MTAPHAIVIVSEFKLKLFQVAKRKIRMFLTLSLPSEMRNIRGII
jgi:hypothetical protein